MERQSTTTAAAWYAVAGILRKKSVWMFAVAALLASCGERDGELSADRSVIGFQVTTTTVESRSASETTSDNLKERPFEVFAFAEDGKPFIGHPCSEGDRTSSEGVEIRHDGTGWDYADPADKAYWPTGSLDFFAFHPRQQEVQGCSLEVISAQHQQLHYALPLDPERQTDILYAIHRRVTRSLHDGQAPLQFRHALTQVCLRARTERSNMEIDIEDIKIHNLSFMGSLTMPAEEESIKQSDWSMGNKVTLQYLPKRLPAPVEHIGTAAVNVSQQLYLPQVLTSWNPKKQTIKVANEARHSYLSVLCRIRQRGVYLWGDEQHCERMFIPFQADWEPGKRYVYTLTFGGGYNENGQRVVAPIGFDVAEEAWVMQEETVPAVPMK